MTTASAEVVGSGPYLQRTVASATDPASLGAALVRRLGSPAVLYERDDEWAVGVGARAEFVVLPGDVVVRHDCGDTSVRYEAGDDPLQIVHKELQRLTPLDWRAYGWVAFELGARMLGVDAEVAPNTVLAHFVVPAREIRLSSRSARLRARHESDLDDLDELIRTTRPEPAARPDRLVDERPEDREYRPRVAEAVAGIRDGAMKKVILSRRVPVPEPIDLPATYLVGRRGNTPARSFLLDLPGLRAAGFSPETVVEVSADGSVSTQPLAGTRARHGDPETDAELRADLLDDSKEILEHVLSVKLAQDEMHELCDEESVHVSEFMDVRERGSVQHLASRLGGRLRPDRNSWHALRGLFPAITVSGIPKREACAWIARTEPVSRGLYGGAVVIADADGSLDAALVLRTVIEYEGHAVLRAGAGVVEDSDPDREFEETCEKLRSVSRFLVAAGPDTAERGEPCGS